MAPFDSIWLQLGKYQLVSHKSSGTFQNNLSVIFWGNHPGLLNSHLHSWKVFQTHPILLTYGYIDLTYITFMTWLSNLEYKISHPSNALCIHDIGVKWSWEGLRHDSEHAVVPAVFVLTWWKLTPKLTFCSRSTPFIGLKGILLSSENYYLHPHLVMRISSIMKSKPMGYIPQILYQCEIYIRFNSMDREELHPQNSCCINRGV